MAYSNITKQALASALKALMDEMPFHKITVTDICARCDMNRKSFYYHFKDKYDLVNWIFDTEFIDAVGKVDHNNLREFFESLCRYFESERKFYRRVLKITGQNSFSEHFEEMLRPLIKHRLERIFGSEMGKFHVVFFSDALVLAIKRWIIEMNDMSADEFVELLYSIVVKTAETIHSEYTTE